MNDCIHNINKKTVRLEIEKFIVKLNSDHPQSDITLRRCLNETWFSDTLAWLLDTKGDHNLGVKFVNEFVTTIAKKRCGSNEYSRRETHLKWKKGGKGKITSGISLKNSTTIREFYLSKGVKKRNGRGQRYCDLVLLDLDMNDSIFLVIENKLFTTNHPDQLKDYYLTVENKFKRVKVREYVYLTLTGTKPILFTNENSKYQKHWIRLSWIDDIQKIIEQLSEKTECYELNHLLKLLQYLQQLKNSSGTIKFDMNKLRGILLDITSDCLLEELNRLGDGKSGSWEIKKSNTGSRVLCHSSTPKHKLYIEMLPNFSITVQGRRHSKQEYEKILIPFGTDPDQIFNLFDLAARDIYHLHFDNPDRYLANRRKLTKTISVSKRENRKFLKFIHKYRFEIHLLLLLSSNIWIGNKDTIERECEITIIDNESSHDMI